MSQSDQSTDTSSVLNKYSRHITQPKSQGASQAMLYATGMNEDDMNKAQVGIASVWYDGNPCNMHLADIATEARKAVQDEGFVGMRFNTVGVSDGISMGTNGMSYSLQSREIIADSIETVMGGQWYDGLITIPGCDKNMPGVAMAMARVNRPAIMIYGGSIRPGRSNKNAEVKLDIVNAFQSYGQFITDAIDEAERRDIVRNSCPGQGSCGGMYTANTMASAIEMLGLSLPYSSSIPAVDNAKIEECARAAKAMRYLLEHDITPSQILTREAFENAMVIVMALGGSTNAVLHLLAMARSAGVDLKIDDFQSVSDRVPFIADLKPSGQYLMNDLHQVGGTPAVMKYLLDKKLITGDGMTVTGKTVEENLRDLPGLDDNQKIIVPVEKPIKDSGHIRILKGNLAPGGSVAKITGKEGLKFSGPARVYDREEAMLKGLEEGEIQKGDVIVIRYEGPKGGPGMPEMLTCTSAVVGAGLANDVAMLTDGRFSGGSHGFIIGHIVPEAQEGGPIGLIKNGDTITIDAETNEINVNVGQAEMENRLSKWQMPAYQATNGTLFKFIKNVKSASEGCVTDE